MSSVHLSPTRSRARASGDHWSYGWRLGGGTGGMVVPPLRIRRALAGRGQNRPPCGETVGRSRRIAHGLSTPFRTVDGFLTPFAQVSCATAVACLARSAAPGAPQSQASEDRWARSSGSRSDGGHAPAASARRRARSLARPSSTSISPVRSPTSRPSASSAPSTRSLWTPASTARCAAAAWPTTTSPPRPCAARRRSARRSCACRSSGPSATRRRWRPRCAWRRAQEGGRGAAFVLAATRLAFCGGFDLDDPEILAEAAAAAGVGARRLPAAARDARRDGAIEAAGRALLAAGADRLPALRVGRALYWGESRRGRGARRGAASLASRSSSALRGDEPGEDLGVEGVDRLGLALVAGGAARQRRLRRAPPRRAAGRARRTACRRSG